MKILARAKSDGKIKIEPPCYANLQASFEKIESVNRKLLRYAWVNFPLAYTQVIIRPSYQFLDLCPILF